MENTIDYQIIIFLIKFTTKFEEEPVLKLHDERICKYDHKMTCDCNMIRLKQAY